jgi:hypothetical protein
MSFFLKRESDGMGDSGGMSILMWEENGEIKVEHDSKPRVGVCVRVGSTYARTMQYQDWWQTSYIKEILEEEENRVKFRTKNSIYEWKII